MQSTGSSGSCPLPVPLSRFSCSLVSAMESTKTSTLSTSYLKSARYPRVPLFIQECRIPISSIRWSAEVSLHSLHPPSSTWPSLGLSEPETTMSQMPAKSFVITGSPTFSIPSLGQWVLVAPCPELLSIPNVKSDHRFLDLSPRHSSSCRSINSPVLFIGSPRLLLRL